LTGWRDAVRGLVLDQVPPDHVMWQVGGADPGDPLSTSRDRRSFISVASALPCFILCSTGRCESLG